MRVRSLSKTGTRTISYYSPQIRRKKVPSIDPPPVRFDLHGRGRGKKGFSDDEDVAAKWPISRFFDSMLNSMKMFLSAFTGKKGKQFGNGDSSGSPLSRVPGGPVAFTPVGKKFGQDHPKRKLTNGNGVSVNYFILMAFSLLERRIRIVFVKY